MVEAGDARECHHVALLIGFGASAVNPYLAVETVQDMARRGVLEGVAEDKAASSLIKALSKGVLKIMSKMGVSTVASYEGAQIFEAVGLGEEVIDTCFAGTTSRLGGVGFDVLAAETGRRHGPGLPGRRQPARAPAAGSRRGVPVAPRGRAAPVQPADGVQAAARHPHPAVRGLQGVHVAGQRPGVPPDDAARADAAARRGGAPGPRADPDRPGRAGVQHRPPVLHRGDVVRLDLSRGPRDPGHRHEPARRPVQHRRRRRGRRALRPGRRG